MSFVNMLACFLRILVTFLIVILGVSKCRLIKISDKIFHTVCVSQSSLELKPFQCSCVLFIPFKITRTKLS